MPHLHACACAQARLVARAAGEELVEFEPLHEAEEWMAVFDADADGEVARREYVTVLAPLGALFASAQSQGACDEGCDTEPGARTGDPTDLLEGVLVDRARPTSRGRRRSERDEL